MLHRGTTRRFLLTSAVLVLSWTGMTVWRYFDRPMFRNEFITHGLPFFPIWRTNPKFDGRTNILVDVRLNTVVFCAPASGFTGSPIPEDISGGALIEIAFASVV